MSCTGINVWDSHYSQKEKIQSVPKVLLSVAYVRFSNFISLHSRTNMVRISIISIIISVLLDTIFLIKI